MIVQACLNGARAPDYHPRLPVSIEALVADGRAAVKAGAAELHLHVRGPDGVESLPDHASVNLKEPGAPAVIERLYRRGMGVEAGLASVPDAERLIRLGLGHLCLRVLIEIEEQMLGEATSVADGILSLLALAELKKPILLHGFDATVWPFVERAVRDGFSTRVGLEDGSALPDGRVAPSNAELVRAAVQLAYGR